MILSKYMGILPEEIRIIGGRCGKPRVEGQGAPKFNLSHSGGLAVFAFSSDREVGIDLEELSPVPKASALAHRFLRLSPLGAPMVLPSIETPSDFLQSWTLQEACLKATGVGLSGSLSAWRNIISSRWAFYRLSVVPGYLSAIAVRGPLGAINKYKVDDAILRGPTL